MRMVNTGNGGSLPADFADTVYDALDNLFENLQRVEHVKIAAVKREQEMMAKSQKSVTLALDAILQKLELPSVRELTEQHAKLSRKTVRSRFQVGIDKSKLMSQSSLDTPVSTTKIMMQFRAYGLPALDVTHTSDPFWILSQLVGDETQEFPSIHRTVYTSEVIKRSLNPVWKPAIVAMHDLCRDDSDMPLLIQVWDQDIHGADLLGYAVTTTKEMRDAIGMEIPLQPAKDKLGTAVAASAGRIKFLCFREAVRGLGRSPDARWPSGTLSVGTLDRAIGEARVKVRPRRTRGSAIALRGWRAGFP